MQTEYENDPESQYDPNDRVYCVHISSFFCNGNSMVYYVGGTRNVEMFLGGMNGMQAFNGPLLFAVSQYDLSFIMQSINLKGPPENRAEREAKSETPLGRNKWRYIYETGRLAWSKSDVDLEKLRELQDKISEDEDLDTIRSEDEQMDVDSENDKDGTKPSNAASKDALRGKEPRMSAVKRGKMRASEEEVRDSETEVETERPRNSGMFKIRLGGNVSKSDTKLKKDTKESTSVQETDKQSEDDRTNLEAYRKVKRLGSVDQIWASLKECVRSDRSNGIQLDSVTKGLGDEVTLLGTREEQLAQKKATASSISGSSRIIAEIAESERDIAAARLRLVQTVANVSAYRWKEEHRRMITDGLRSLQQRGARKHQIKTFLMNLLLYQGRDESSGGTTNALQTEEIQSVMNLVDNLELQKEYLEVIQNLDGNDVVMEEFARLKDLGNTLDIDGHKHVSDVVAILFRYGHDIQVRGMMDMTNREEITSAGLSDYQQKLVTQVMETINQNKSVATDLLYKSWWNIEVAITQWYESEAPTKLKLDLDTSTSTDCTSDLSLLGSRSPAKRPYVAEAGPSQSRKKRRTNSHESQETRSPEEDLTAAQARLDRIITEEHAAELERAKKSKQETDKTAKERSEDTEPTLQANAAAGFKSYSLEALKKLIAAETNTHAGSSQEIEITKSNDETDSKSSTADKSSNMLPTNDKRYNLRDRGERIDYSGINREVENALQEKIAAAKPSAVSKDLLQKPTNLLPEGTPVGISNLRDRTPSGQELGVLVDNLPIPPSSNRWPTADLSSVRTKMSSRHGLDIEGTQVRSDQPQDLDSSNSYNTHHFTQQEIEALANQYATMHRLTFSQPFVPVSPPETSRLGLLSPGEGMHKALKFLHSGSLTLAPQYMPSIDQLRDMACPPENSSPRGESPAPQRDVPEIRQSLSSTLQTSRPAIPLQPLQPRTSALRQPLHVSSQAEQDPVPTQSVPSEQAQEGIPYSTAPYTFPSSPALRPSSGPSLASDRDLSSLPEDSSPPTTHPDCAVLGPYGAKMNDPMFQDSTDGSTTSLNDAETAVPDSEKEDTWRRDSAHRMSIASAAAFAQNQLDAHEAAQTTSQIQHGIDDEAGRRVRFADREEIFDLGIEEPGVENHKTQNMVDEGESEAEQPKEWDEDV
ncbi:hypothetical protein EKO04_009549 [Ascochyta lentis]|uniref:Uncharacterized protein n=1 Tax=Ascochyta lentis TaxID=205686 RepID=A0A8H7MGP3_9PLEO|nr:hypothetical protein EKO04_009549 [Ascochyta lentis]